MKAGEGIGEARGLEEGLRRLEEGLGGGWESA